MDDAELAARLLRDLPSEAAPRAHWPEANPLKQTAIESRCFEDGATIHFDKLRPLHSWAPLLGSGHDLRTAFVATNCIKLALRSNLKLNQSEIDAISETSAMNFNRAAWARPLAYGITAAVVYNNRQTFRVPFYTLTKAKWFDPSAFPTARRAVFRGSTATAAWHTVRAMAYLQLIKIGTSMFYASIASTSIAAATLSDSRLAYINREILQRTSPGVDLSNHPRFKNMSQVPAGAEAQERQHLDYSDAERRAESYRRVGMPPPPTGSFQGTGQQRQRPQSSSIGQSPEDWQGQDSQAPVDWDPSESQSAKEAKVRELLGRSDATSTARPDWRAPAQQQQSRQSESSGAWDNADLLDEDDDASPVSAAAKRAEQAARSREQGAGSGAWTRVRQQAKADADMSTRGARTGPGTTWSQLQQDAAPTDRDRQATPPKENYTYSESDETKNYAKSQAQKEFDAMLEAERKGDRENNRRWS